MPELDPDMLREDRGRVALAYLEGIMLWPRNPEQRQIALQASEAANWKERADAAAEGPEGNVTIPLSVMAAIVEARPVKLIQSDNVKTPFQRGLTAGNILFWTLQSKTTGAGRGIQEVKSNLIVEYKGKQDFAHLSMKTMELIWDHFKEVSHFWAAFLVHCSVGLEEFPCTLGKFRQFLGLAEHIRELGESVVTGGGSACCRLTGPGPFLRVYSFRRQRSHGTNGAGEPSNRLKVLIND